MAIDTGELLIAQVNINGLSIPAMIDTGAMRSLIHHSIVNTSISPTNIKLKSASGHLLPISGIAQTTFSFNNTPLSHKLFVVQDDSLPTKILLGMDFLRSHSCKINTNPAEFFVYDEPATLLSFHTAFPGLPSIDESQYVHNILEPWRTTEFSDDEEDEYYYNYFEFNCVGEDNVSIEENSIGSVSLKLQGHLPFFHEGLACEFIPKCGSTAYSYLQPAIYSVNKEGDSYFIRVPYVNTDSDPVKLRSTEVLGIASLIHIDSPPPPTDNITTVNAVTSTPDSGSSDPFLSTPESVNNVSTNGFDFKDPARLAKVDAMIDKLISKKKWANLEMKGLVREYPTVFRLDDEPMTVSTLFAHKIRLKDNNPVFRKPYAIPMKLQSQVNEQLQQMLKDGIIKYSRSSYNSPLIPVLKADGSVRICQDFRMLNSKIFTDTYPLPNIPEIFYALGKGKVFSSIDLRHGYFQIPLHPDSTPCTAFSSFNDKFEYVVTPQGISDAPAGFQRIINHVLAGLVDVRAFLDDILCFTETEEEHLQSLRRVFAKLAQAELCIKLSKCKFFQSSLKFLGHIVSDKGLSPDPAKVEAIQKISIPKNIKQLQSFLGLVNYYKKFIENFSEHALPLTNLIRGKNEKGKKISPPIAWSEEADKAFNFLKSALCQDVILHYPDFSKEFSLASDASNYSVGGSLEQIGDDGDRRPLLFTVQN